MGKIDYKKFFDINSLIKDIKKYLPDFDVKLFKKAFGFAEEAHRGQIRKDEKTPYLAHSVAVVENLSRLHADQDVLIAALLHDVPEDTKHEIDDVERLFGKKVAFLVNGITKLSKVHYQHNMPQRQVESLKKLFLHSAKDPCVILIKLADRLHNMRTLGYVKEPEKRLRIAKETLEIFVPMANLLGIQELKSELEDLCFQFLFPPEYEKLSKILNDKFRKNKPSIKKFISRLDGALKKEKISAEILHSKQNLYTIYKKLCANNRTLDNFVDRVIVKIIVKNIPACYEALGIVHRLFTPKTGKFKDYIASPKINKYRSLHTMVFGANGLLTEVQIRTEDMHLEANFGIAANFFCPRKGKLSKDCRSLWVNRIIEIEKNGNQNFLEDLKVDIFQDRIFIFTPKGGKVDLPTGATAIDFAYAIHSQVGNHASRANINGSILPITTTLKTGDVVDIVTDKASSPTLSWFSFTKTNLAKTKIHNYLKKVSKNKKVIEGRKILQKEFDIIGLGLIEKMSFRKMNLQLMANLGRNFHRLEDLFIAIGEGEVNSADAMKAITSGRPAKKAAKDMTGIKINVKIVTKNRFGLMADISKVFYRHALDITYIKAWTSRKLQDADIKLQVIVPDLESVTCIFDELEQIEGVKYVYRIPTRQLVIAYSLIGVMATIWALHPFILRFIVKLPFLNPTEFISDLMVYIWLFLMFVMIISITNMVKNYLPFVRNRKILWTIAFGMPVLAILTLLIDLFYFDVQLSWWALLLELAFIYIYLLVSFLNLKSITSPS